MSLQNRTALVTGGSHGIGRAVVRRLLEEGARVAFCARDGVGLAEAHAELSAVSRDVLPIQADVSARREVDTLMSRIVERFGGVDILVNCAGVLGPIGPAWDNDPDLWQETLAINVMGTFLVCRAVVPRMIEAGHGRIVNVAGGGAATPLPRYTAYAASKAALVRFTETLAVELAPHNVQVNAVAPGFVATRMHQQTLDAGDRAGAGYLRTTREQLAQGGVDPAIPAGLVAYLASDRAGALTGKLISAVWDNWQDFGRHLDEITASDVYTLRRIVPADRGLDWK